MSPNKSLRANWPRFRRQVGAVAGRCTELTVFLVYEVL
jgi:hypothetical protein